MKSLRQIFAAPSATELAVRELADAQRALLLAQTSLDHSKASVQYNQDRISRLESYLRALGVN